MSEVGKKLEQIYQAMLEAYRSEDDKETGARKALEVYDKSEAEISDVDYYLRLIEDLKRSFQEGLKALEEARAKEEKRARTIRTGGSVVIKLVPCGKHCSGCPHGPYAYSVHKEGGKQIWKYLGKARDVSS